MFGDLSAMQQFQFKLGFKFLSLHLSRFKKKNKPHLVLGFLQPSFLLTCTFQRGVQTGHSDATWNNQVFPH